MTTRWFAAIAAFALLAWGCQEAPKAPTPDPAPAAATPDKAKVAAEKTEATKAPAKAPAATKPPAKKPAPKVVSKKAAANPKAGKLVRWDAPIEWLDWDAGLAKAKASKTPILLLVYADW